MDDLSYKICFAYGNGGLGLYFGGCMVWHIDKENSVQRLSRTVCSRAFMIGKIVALHNLMLLTRYILLVPKDNLVLIFAER